MAGVAFVTNSLEISHTLKILESPPDVCINTAPVNVKGGEVYVFRAQDTDKQGV